MIDVFRCEDPTRKVQMTYLEVETEIIKYFWKK